MKFSTQFLAVAFWLMLSPATATSVLADNLSVSSTDVSDILGAYVADSDLAAYRGGTARQDNDALGNLAQPRWITIPGSIAGGNAANIKVLSLKELRFRTTVRQQYDYSCGSAALATLLNQYHDSLDEETIFKEMWNSGDQEKIRREGFSLLDIKTYLQSRGYNANGYVAPVDKLVEVGIPAIAMINDNGYNHFVVVKGVRNDKVLLGDPSAGSRILSRAEFDRMRLKNNILFVIVGKRELAVFNAENDWQIRPKAPLGIATNPDILSNIGFLRRSPSDF
ncbi:MAG: C39 family peptidase [Pseudomonadota bacterium]